MARSVRFIVPLVSLPLMVPTSLGREVIPCPCPFAAGPEGARPLLDEGVTNRTPVEYLVIGGVAGMLVGWTGSLGIGALFPSECEGWFCVPPSVYAALLASLLVEPLGVAGGVHLANGRQGDFGRVFGSAVGSNIVGFTAGVIVSTATESPYGLIIWPVYQLYHVVRKEIATSRPAAAGRSPVPGFMGVR